MQDLFGTEALDFFKTQLESKENDCVLWDGASLFIYRAGDHHFYKWSLNLNYSKEMFFCKWCVEDADYIYDYPHLQVLTKENVEGTFSIQNQSISINGSLYNLKVHLDPFDYHPDQDVKGLEKQYTIRNMAVMKYICPVLERHLSFKCEEEGADLSGAIDSYMKTF